MTGCLNYSLVLRIDRHGDLGTITGTNAFVMSRVCRALQKIATEEVRVDGQTDLVLGGRKFSGNAQRRRLRSVLFHGVLLLSADIALVAATLKMPPRQPLYRRNRTHEEFLVNAGWTAEQVRRELCGEWNAGEPLASLPGSGWRSWSERSTRRGSGLTCDERIDSAKTRSEQSPEKNPYNLRVPGALREVFV